MDNQQINEVFQLVSNSILSSKSLLQLETSERLMELFRKQYTYPELTEKLNSIFLNKAAALHYFEWKRFRDGDLEAA
ncbi:MAG: hypothetical protein M3R17_06400 [Bacteroidota bacterium]|nr:hypothetical protein [Bacteroidota bacterium]